MTVDVLKRLICHWPLPSDLSRTEDLNSIWIHTYTYIFMCSEAVAQAPSVSQLNRATAHIPPRKLVISLLGSAHKLLYFFFCS